MWNIRSVSTPPSMEAVSAVVEALGCSPILGALLQLRGYVDPKQAGDFLFMKTEMLGDPFAIRDMEAAVARIQKAIERHEKIVVYGDYDVDGVTAVCALYLYLKERGADIG